MGINQIFEEEGYRTKANDLFNSVMVNALWSDRHERELDAEIATAKAAEEEADAYFAYINKEETPSSVTEEAFNLIPEDRLKRSARRKADIRHKAKNGETLRHIYDKANADPEVNRKADHASLDFKFFGRDLDDLILKGKRLSEIGGVPKRKNYSKATRRDPDVPMHGSGYKKSENWKAK